MKRMLFSMVLLALLPVAQLAGQQSQMVSGAEGARLARMDNRTTWLGALAGDLDRVVAIGLIIMPMEGIDLRSGDVVQKLNGRPVASVGVLVREYGTLAVGAPVRLTVKRGGKTVVVVFAKPHPSKVPDLNVQRGSMDSGAKRPALPGS
jgi:S1-C subfamily serine protease